MRIISLVGLPNWHHRQPRKMKEIFNPRVQENMIRPESPFTPGIQFGKNQQKGLPNPRQSF